MANYNKNSVKLLQKIEKHDNNTYFYTEFNGEYNIGDILYISTKNNSGGVQNIIDSLYTQKGYKLLSKKGNRLELEISYNHLEDNGITSMPPYNSSDTNEAYIGRVYINNATIKRGNINNTILHDVIIEPSTKGDVNLIQSILVSIKEKNSERKIKNIDFNNKYSDGIQILKSEYNINSPNDNIESYYTDNNNNFGVSYINLSDNIIELENCNINSGIFRDCILNGDNNTITNGYLEECDVDGYIIDNGYFNNCILNLNNTWNFGYWINSGETGSEFQVIDWNDGVWINGYFPPVSTWYNGTFMNGKFEGNEWNNGEFQSGVFTSSVWNNGVFNSGLFEKSEWHNGEFYDGQIVDSIWVDGIFHDGIMYSSDDNQKVIWSGGTVNDGSFLYVDWKDGIVNYCDFFQCDWTTGVFNNGQMLECNWEDGKFYDGIIQGKTETLPINTNRISFAETQTTYEHNAINTPYTFYCNENGIGEILIDGNGIEVTANSTSFTWDYNGNDTKIFYFNNLQNVNTIFRTYNGIRYVITIESVDFVDSILDVDVNFTITALDGNVTHYNTWEKGIFFNGTMLDMDWNKGIVYNGIFYNIDWVSGIWYNGTAVNSKFINVDWYNGIFNSTNTKYQVIDNGTSNPADDFDIINGYGIIIGGTWYNGVFNNGVFGLDTEPNIDAIWEKGNFYNGIYNGDSWRGGLFYNGIVSIRKFIPERYKVNKSYKAYNTDKLKNNKHKLTRNLKSNFRRKVSKYITPRTKPSTSTLGR